MVDIKILNNDSEMRSFPITQSIKLISNTELDTKSLSDHIILFRIIPEKGLVSLVEPYSYTVGFIKEKFNTTDLSFSQELSSDGGYVITATPQKVLNLDSDYILYITKNVLASNTKITKTNSKSSSTISATAGLPVSPQVVTVSVKSTSKLTSTSNLVVFNINGTDYPVNVKENKTITVNRVTYTFIDTVYVEGETFSIEVNSEVVSNSIQDIMYKFRTAPSSSIAPIEGQKPSSGINTQDILNFYSKVQEIKEVVPTVPKYIAPNIFTITLPDGYEVAYNEEFELSIREAFNNYLLTNLELYDKATYSIYIYQEDNEAFIEVVYNEDEDILLTENEDTIKFKVKRGRR